MSALWIGLREISISASDRRRLEARENKADHLWMWSDLTIKNYSNFDKGQPDNNGGFSEECVAMMGTKKKWHDAPCKAKLNFICQKCGVGMDDCGGAGSSQRSSSL